MIISILDLSGNAKEIYRRASDIVFELIPRIAKEKPEPKEQEGEVVEFQRRAPEMSKDSTRRRIGKGL